jgi:hypothetical protein
MRGAYCCNVAARWLALIVIAQKSRREEREGKRGRGVTVKAGWDGVCSRYRASG